MPQLAQPRTRRAYTYLTPEEHRELMHVCKLSRKSASELLHAGLMQIMRWHLRYRGAEKHRLAAISSRTYSVTQRRETTTSTCRPAKPLPIPPTRR